MSEVVAVAVAERRAQALAERDWATVREQPHPDFVYTTASGHRLDRRSSSRGTSRCWRAQSSTT